MKVVIEILAAALILQAGIVLSWDQVRIAEPGQFPHQSAIMWKPSEIVMHFTLCSGSILNKLWILTSAYCIAYAPQLGTNVIKVGSYDINVNDEHTQIVEIDKFISHDKYPGISPVLSNFAQYDIGLIKLITELIFNAFVKPIKLPRPDGLIKGGEKLEYNLIQSGWGLFPYSLVPDRPTTMRTIKLPIVPNKVCTASIRQTFPVIKLSDKQICTRPFDGSLGACIGNYGGGIIQYDKKNETVVVGIVNWNSASCSTNGIPRVYTRVGYFVNWIKDKMKT